MCYKNKCLVWAHHNELCDKYTPKILEYKQNLKKNDF